MYILYAVKDEGRYMSQKSYTFLLGAGAEGKGQLNICSRNDYKIKMIQAEKVKKFASVFNKKFEKSFQEGPLITWNSTQVLYRAIEESINEATWNNRDELSRKIMQVLGLDVKEDKIVDFVEDIVNYCLYKQKETEYDKEARNDIVQSFADVYEKKIFKPIADKVERKMLNEEDGKLLDYFLKNASIYGYYDSLFNCLRRPNVYQREVGRVKKIYFTALKVICDAIYSVAGKINECETFTDYLKKMNATNRDEINKGFEVIHDKVIEVCSNRKNLYYSSIKRLLDKSQRRLDQCDDVENLRIGDNINIVTTNYTWFAEKITEIDSKHIFYMHGKLGEFESVNTKHIDTYNKFSEEEDIFPYLLVQSGIKPIINSQQIETFYRGSKCLLDADEVIILGYGFNSDDEHIINILRERVRAGKKIVYFCYDETSLVEKNNKLIKEKNKVKNLLCITTDNLIEIKSAKEFDEYIGMIIHE